MYLKWLYGRFDMNQPRGLRHEIDLADFGLNFAQIWPFLPRKMTLVVKKNFNIYSKWLHGRFGMNQPRGLRHDLDLADFGPIFAQIWPFLAQKVTLRGSNKPELISE